MIVFDLDGGYRKISRWYLGSRIDIILWLIDGYEGGKENKSNFFIL